MEAFEDMSSPIKGYYLDTLANSSNEILWKSGWCSNHVVNNCSVLLAGLMKNQPGMQGILYFAIGQGMTEWDAHLPDPDHSNDQLTQEINRQLLKPQQIVYLNEFNEPTTIPSGLLEISAEFKGQDIVKNGLQPLREFGLFGGNATDAANSGFMIDHVIHPRIDLERDKKLIRKMRLVFETGIGPLDHIIDFGSNLPVISIDGVGTKYSDILKNQGVEKIADLVKVDPLTPIGRIPMIKLREFRAKARIVLQTEINLLPYTKLQKWNISRVLKEKPENLVDKIGDPDVTKKMVTSLQEKLAILQVALDDVQLQKITIGDLLGT